jgi:hypothetical protein
LTAVDENGCLLNRAVVPGGADADEPTRWRDLLAVIAPALALVSVLAFGVVRVSYERFYAEFGLVPEDVGANSTTVLGQSGSHFVLYAFLFAVVPYGMALAVFALLASWLKTRSRSRFWAVVPALLPLAVYQELTGGGILGYYMLVTALAALGAYAWWTAHPTVRQWQAGFLWFSAGVFLLTLFYLPGAAARAGKCVYSEPGMGLRAVHTRRKLPGKPPLEVLALRAQPVDVRWLGDASTRPSLGRHMVYLGEVAGIAVLFDSDRRAVIRLPIGQTALTTPARSPACPEFDYE